MDSVGRIVFVRLGPIDGFVPRIVLIRAKNGIRVGNGKVIDFNIGCAVDRMIEIGHLCLSIVDDEKKNYIYFYFFFRDRYKNNILKNNL